MTPSPEQEAFFSEIQTTSNSILLEASAGSGKTTTIVHSTSLLPPGLLTVFLAFNKKIAEELERRCPRTVQVNTFHSRSFRALSRSLPKSPRLAGVNGVPPKIRSILKSNLKYKDLEMYGAFVSKLVSLAKSAGLGTHILEDTPDNWRQLISHFALTLDSRDADETRAIELASLTLTESNSDTAVIDFDDMLYLALLRRVRFDQAGLVFVDEAQDTNGVQRELLKAMLGPTSRLVAVGDPHQSIYGFRGADASAMDELASTFSMKRMPLSVSYRCSKAVVREAQKYLR